MDKNQREELNKELCEEIRGKGAPDRIKELLEAGADPNATYWYQITALHFIVSMENMEATKLLADSGADINAKDSAGQSVLHWACENENLNCIKLLLDLGADIFASNEHKDTPLHYAARNSFSQAGAVLLLLKAGADVNALNTEGQTALYNAAKKGNIFCMQVLSDHGCDPEIRDIHGKTADDILEERSTELFRQYKNIQRIKDEDRRKSITTGYEFDI